MPREKRKTTAFEVVKKEYRTKKKKTKKKRIKPETDINCLCIYMSPI